MKELKKRYLVSFPSEEYCGSLFDGLRASFDTIEEVKEHIREINFKL